LWEYILIRLQKLESYIIYNIIMNQSTEILDVYILLNKVLYNLIRKKFGPHFSIRLNSLKFISNRTNIFYLHTCTEKLSLKSIKPVSINELIIIKQFILFNINISLHCIECKSYMEVTDVEIMIV